MNIRSLFNQIPASGMPISDLQLFKQYVQQATGGPNFGEAQEALIKLQQNSDFIFHLQSLLESLYHYDDISKLNKEFNDVAFQQMLIYASILIQNLMTKDQQLLSQNGIILLYITTIHLVTKYSKIQATKKHLIECLSRINTLVQILPIDLQISLFDVLLEFISQQIQQPQPSNLIPVLLILESLVHFLFEMTQLQEKFKIVVQQTFLLLDKPYLLEDGTNETNISISQLLVVLAEKYSRFYPEQLQMLTRINQITSFINQQCQSNNSLQVKTNLLKFLSLIEDERNKTQDQVDELYLALIVTLIPYLLDQYVEVQDEGDGHHFRLEILQIMLHTLGIPQLYNFYHSNAQKIFCIILLQNLYCNTEERSNFIENPVDYFNLQKQLVKQKKMETMKGYSAQITSKMCQKIDGFLPFVSHFAIEYLTYLITNQDETIIQSRQFCQQFEQTKFFTYADDDKLDILLLVLCLIHNELTPRRDIRKKLQHFIRIYLSFFSQHPESFIKARIILLLRFYLPRLFKNQEPIFSKCVKFFFKLLSTSNNKSKSLKMFAVDALSNLVDDEDTNQRMEASLINNMNEFCHYLTFSNTDNYYKLVSKVLGSYQPIIDQFLSKILTSIVVRLKDIFKPRKDDPISQLKQKKKAGTNITSCLNLLTTILSYNYCLENQSAQIEPSLLDICSLFLEQEKYQLFLDETLDMLSIYVQFTRGMTNITYRVFDHLPSFIRDTNKVTITTVFQFYYISITECQSVIMTRPLWIKYIIDHLLALLNAEQIDNLKNDCTDFIKIMITLNALIQNLPQMIIEYIPNIVKQMNVLIQTLTQIPYLKQLSAKVIHTIYTPFLFDNSLIDPVSQNIILTTIRHIKDVYSGPQTIYNYKLLFQINKFLILNSYKLWQQNEVQEVCFQLLTFTIQQIVAYIDKVNFNQKIGSLNYNQKAPKNQKNSDLQIEDEKDQDYDDQEQQEDFPQMGNNLGGDFVQMIMMYNKEKQIESQVNLDLLPLAQQDLEPVKQIVEFLKLNLPTVLQALTQDQAQTLRELMQTEKLLNQSSEIEFRKIITGRKRKIIH